MAFQQYVYFLRTSATLTACTTPFGAGAASEAAVAKLQTRRDMIQAGVGVGIIGGGTLIDAGATCVLAVGLGMGRDGLVLLVVSTADVWVVG